jgi:hypothetical protein
MDIKDNLEEALAGFKWENVDQVILAWDLKSIVVQGSIAML